MKPGHHVEFAEDEDDHIIHLSSKEKTKVDSIMRPMLEEILKELGFKIKDNLPKNKQRRNKSK